MLIHDRHWYDCLNELLSFRRFLRSNFGIRVHDEIKAQFLLRRSGPLTKSTLSFPARIRIYELFMRLQPKLGTVRTFAVSVNKARVKNQSAVDPREMAWRMAIQRIERWGNDQDENVMLFPDEGHGKFIKRKLRQMRRFSIVPSAYGTGTLSRPTTNIIEDPSDRLSHESYFVQLADLNAYAAYRRVHPHPKFPTLMWEHLGASRIEDVHKVRGGAAPGLVSWP